MSSNVFGANHLGMFDRSITDGPLGCREHGEQDRFPIAATGEDHRTPNGHSPQAVGVHDWGPAIAVTDGPVVGEALEEHLKAHLELLIEPVPILLRCGGPAWTHGPPHLAVGALGHAACH
jgi:hypothetical protein